MRQDGGDTEIEAAAKVKTEEVEVIRGRKPYGNAEQDIELSNEEEQSLDEYQKWVEQQVLDELNDIPTAKKG